MMQEDSQNHNPLVGRWRVKSIDMIEGRAVSLIGGLPGEYVEFTQEGRYQIGPRTRQHGTSRYRVDTTKSLPELDIWIPSLKSLVARCIYLLSGNELFLCVAGNNGERPTELRRDDEQLWCVITFERSARRTRQKASE